MDKIRTGNIIEAKENVGKVYYRQRNDEFIGFCRYGLWEIRKYRALGISKCYINVYQTKLLF